ncbi:hypothetical protein [Myroides sp. WP-1]|uniref:hypothetical protein n=1 Tax=Myroides sp. WP-1 TaxID=2759944 RepID=UPI0015FBE768|nr:hypothetical protein [Myroides sp. WP-1]MBB1139110.1 hypothetical protein [Myroides sp. WP-1]
MLEFVTYLADFIPIVLVILIAYVLTKKPYDLYKKALIGYLATGLCFYLLGEILGRIQGNNLVLIPIFGAIELGWFSYIYFYYTRKTIFLYSNIPVLICLFYELNRIDFLTLNQLQSYTRSIAALTLCIFTLGYSYSLLKYKWKNYNANVFVFNASLLIYASFTCIYYLPLQLLVSGNPTKILVFWMVNSLITFIFYILMTNALCHIPKKMSM